MDIRQERLEEAKQRALGILDSDARGRFCLAFLSFISDLGKDEENTGRYLSEVMMAGLLAATAEEEAELRRWIGSID